MVRGVRGAWAAASPAAAALRQRRSRTAAGWARPRRRSWPGVCAARGLVAGGSLLIDDDALFAPGRRHRGPPRQRGAGVLRRVHGRLRRGRPVPRRPRDGRPAGRRRGVRARRTRSRQKVARGLLPEVGARTRTPRPTPAAPRCSSPRWASGRSCCSTRPRTGCTSTTASPRCPRRWHWSDLCARTGMPAVVSGAGPTVLVLTDRSSQPAGRAAVPAGWAVHLLAVGTLRGIGRRRLSPSPGSPRESRAACPRCDSCDPLTPMVLGCRCAGDRGFPRSDDSDQAPSIRTSALFPRSHNSETATPRRLASRRTVRDRDREPPEHGRRRHSDGPGRGKDLT